MLEFLSIETSLARSFYLVPRFAATCCGCWPHPERSWPAVLIFWLCFSQEVMGAVAAFLYGCMRIQDLVAALEAFCPSLTILLSLVKISTLILYRKQISVMIEHIKSILLTASNNPVKRKIVQKWSSTGNTLCFILFVCGTATSVAFVVLPLMMNLWRKWHGKEILRLLPFPIYLPSAFSEYPLYTFTYMSLTYISFITTAAYTSMDGFYLCTCCYLSASFYLLQYDIQQIFAELELSPEPASVAQGVRFRKQLKGIVIRHIELRELCNEFSRRLGIVLFCHFFLAAVVLGLGILDFILNFPSLSILMYFVYTITVVMQFYMYCSGGSFVSEGCTNVADVLYNIEWYKCDPETRKMILMILREAQQMKTIELPFFTASLPAFNSYLAKTGSYVAMLNTFF